MVVGYSHVVGHSVSLPAGVVAASAGGRELTAVDDVACFGGGIDVGDNDALRSAVERAVDQALRVLVDPHHWRQSPKVASACQVAEIGGVDACVFAFEPYGVDAVCVCDWSEDVDVVGVGESDYGGCHFAGVYFVFYAIGSELHVSVGLSVGRGRLWIPVCRV